MTRKPPDSKAAAQTIVDHDIPHCRVMKFLSEVSKSVF